MSVKKNYIYNLSYQLVTIAFPLITIPYISRVLGSDGVGTYAFTASIVQYFVLFGMLGLGTYGSKCIAESRDDKKMLSQTFLSIYALQLIMTCLSLLIYILFLEYGAYYDDKQIMYMQGLTLLSCLVDCSWFFSGLEKFKQIVLRNLIVKIASLILIFTLVKASDDLLLYTLIMTGSAFIGQLVLWFGMKNHISIVSVNISQVMKHFRPVLAYFIPQIALQIYFVLNKTMIGILSTESEVGIFDYSDKMLKICLAFITSLGTVMLPKMAYMFSKGEEEKTKKYIMYSLDFSTMIAVPIMLGLAGISLELIPWYLGEDFHKSIYVLLIISPTIFFMSWSGVFGNQYLLPLGLMKVYTASVYIGAIVNLVMNLLLIKPFGSIGAAVATLTAEFCVMGTQLIYMRKHLEFKKILVKSLDYCLAGIIMFAVIRMIGHYFGAHFITTLIQIIAGVVIYMSIVILIEFIKKEGLVIQEAKKVIDTMKSRFIKDIDENVS